MKMVILIGIILFSFELRTEAKNWEIFSARQESVGHSLYNQAKKQIRKLKNALKRERLFNKVDFSRLVRLIKSNDITLVMRILEKYQLKGGTAVDKAVKNLHNRLYALSKKGKVSKLQNNVCPGSGLKQTEFFSTERAFAALKTSGVVITWGDDSFGGDSGSVADKLGCGVVKIFSTGSAFAAIRFDGSVVTWGNIEAGGDSSSVSKQLANGVKEIISAQSAFAAIKTNGSLVVWGDRYRGGKLSIMRESYRQFGGWEEFPLHTSLWDGTRGRVIKVVATDFAFAAILEEKKDPTKKTVFVWGDELFGGDPAVHTVAGILGGIDSRDGQYISSMKMKDISPLLKDGVEDIFSTASAFAALKSDGSVVTWGDRDGGGDSDSVSDQIQNGVEKIFSNESAFAALKSDGSVVAWGHPSKGGDSSLVSAQLQGNIVNIVSNEIGFAAIKSDGSVVIWGDKIYNQKFDPKLGAPDEVVNIVASGRSFAALQKDGSVNNWGEISYYESVFKDALSGDIVAVFANNDVFAALKKNGGVVTWGWEESGGDVPQLISAYWDARDTVYETDNSLTEEQIRSQTVHHLYRIKSGVVKIASTKAAFVALRSNGTIVTWGASGYGADSSGVASLFGENVHQ